MAELVVYKTVITEKGVNVKNTDGLNITSNDAEYLIKEIIKVHDTAKIAVVWNGFTDFWEALFTIMPDDIRRLLDRGNAANYQRMRLWWGETRWARIIGLRADFREHIKDNFFNKERKEITIAELKQYYDWLDNQTMEQTYELGTQLLKTLDDMGLEYKDVNSAISIFKYSVLDKMDTANVYNMPESSLDAMEYAFNAVEEWEANFRNPADNEKVIAYDLTNAYGSALAELPDLKNADIVYSEKIMDGCAWGILNGTIHNKTNISPLFNPETKSAYLGYWKGYIPLDLYACVLGWNIGDVKIKDGWFIFPKNSDKPFEKIMKKLYSMRGNELLKNNLAKSMSVATWGKMLEQREGDYGIEYGSLFCPIYGSMVVNKIKVKDTDFIYHNKLNNDSLVSVRVDGVKSLIDLPIPAERKFGEWRKEV